MYEKRIDFCLAKNFMKKSIVVADVGAKIEDICEVMIDENYEWNTSQ